MRDLDHPWVAAKFSAYLLAAALTVGSAYAGAIWLVQHHHGDILVMIIALLLIVFARLWRRWEQARLHRIKHLHHWKDK